MLNLINTKTILLPTHWIIKRLKFMTSTQFSHKNTSQDKSQQSNLEQQFRSCQAQRSISKYFSILKKQGAESYHWKAHFQIAALYLKSNQHQKAINHYSTALKLQPSQVDIYIQLAQCLKQAGDIYESIAVLEKGLQLNLNSRQLSNCLGELYVNIQQYIKAFDTHRLYKHQILIHNSQYHKQSSNINVLLQQFSQKQQNQLISEYIKMYFLTNNKVQQGIQFFEHVLKQRYSFFSLLNIGAIYLQSGNYVQAKSYLIEAQTLNSNHYNNNLYLAIIALQQNNDQEAVKYFERAAAIDPKQSMPISSLGLISMKNKDNKKAVQLFQKALTINSNDSIALSSLGVIVTANNQLDRGIIYLRKALQIDPQNQVAMEKLKVTLMILGRQQQFQEFQTKLKVSKKV